MRSPVAVSQRPRVLITGASGFIGGHLFRRFRALGWDVVGLGRTRLRLPGYFVHDLTQPLPDSVGRFDVVIHAAARASPWGRRREFERQNVWATRHVIDHCIRHGLPRLIFLSSSSVHYAAGHQFNITEETPFPVRPVNVYAATKRKGEALVRQYPGDGIILRPRAVFGPGDTVLLPRILEAARVGKLPLLADPEGAAVGDLIYIDNLIDAAVRAAADPQVRGCFNLTNNEPVPIRAFLLDIFRRLNIPEPRRRVTLRKAMLGATILEGFYSFCLPDREPPITRFGVHVFAYSKTFRVTRMLQQFGPPRITLGEGVEQTVAWIRGGEPSLSVTS